MKKIIPILLVVITIMSAGAFFIYRKQSDIKDSQTINYTMKEFIYAPTTIKNKQVQADPVDYGESVPLQSVLDNFYYVVNFPNTISADDIITDYVSFIATKDMSVYVQKLSGINPDDFSTSVGIDNPNSLTSNCIEEQFSGKKEEQRASVLFGSTAYVLRCSDNPVAYATILKSFMETDITPYENFGVNSYNQLEQLPTYEIEEQYICDIDHDFNNVTTRTFYFDNSGYLSMYRELSSFNDAIIHAIDKLSIIIGRDIDNCTYYMNDKLFYMEYGYYSCIIVNVNYNTSIVLFGIGDNAKANITLYGSAI